MRLFPHRNMLYCVGGLALFALLTSVDAIFFANQLHSSRLFYILLSLFLVACLFDVIQLKLQHAPQVSRTIAPNIAIDRPCAVLFELTPHSLGNIKLRDFVPDFCSLDKTEIQFGKKRHSEYLLTPKKRGLLSIEQLEIGFNSRLLLWQRIDRQRVVTQTRVYPDFERVQGYELLAQSNQSNQMGIRRKPRRGLGSDFHQLREYRQGDSLKQIDWNATARRQQLVSREYQDERDQQIVFLLDSGKQMLAQEDDQIAHFDHSLNALLLLAHLALKQGDWVSMMSFGAEQRKVSAIRGSQNINKILNQYYDLQASAVASDYESAAEHLIKWQRKRSLVIMVTNAREEQQHELTKAIRLLSKHHLLVLANLRESSLEEILQQPITTAEQAMLYTGTQAWLQRSLVLRQLVERSGAIYLDCYPQHLLTELANTYLSLKAQGRV